MIIEQPDCILPKSFFEGRYVPSLHEDSLDYVQWWEEQERRCKEGWTDGGHTITGVHYYHMNFKKINMLDKNNAPVFAFPYYAYEDQELFQNVEDARSQGKGLILITGRGFGKSFDATSIIEREYIFYPATECILSASTDFFADELMRKVRIGINSNPDEFRPTALVDKVDKIESGWEEKVEGKKKIYGNRSIIRKVVYDNDPGRTRGTRPNVHVFEEIGSWTGKAKLTDCYNQTEASWWRGGVFTCFPLLIGTGGMMESGASEDAKKMFWNPEAYNLLAFEYQDEKIGKFYPAYKKFGGYYEKTGISDEVGAKAFLDARREKKKKDLKVFRQEQQEFPFTPEEAFMVSGTNTFDTEKLYARYDYARRSGDFDKIKKGDFDFVRSGSKIIGVTWRENGIGPFEILEHPRILPGDDKPLKYTYVSGCDSYDAIEEKSDDNKSKGSIFVFKRFINAGETGRIFVAKLTQRPDNASTFYWNTVKLNMYYNALMLYEHTKIGIATHYITNKLEYLLMPKPKLDEVNPKGKSTSTNRYGLAMPIQVKMHLVNAYGEYIEEYTDQMYFESQILDAINFRFGSSKFDETMAAGLAIIADSELYDITIRETKKKAVSFPKFKRDAKGNLIFD